MKRNKTIMLTLVIIILLIPLLLFSRRNYQSERATIIPIATPTLFVHGWGSSYHAEENMVSAAQKSGASNSVIRADVSPDGKVTLIGTIKKNAKNPIIEANFQNNKSVSPYATNQALSLSKSSNYVKDIILTLQKKYHFKKINLVGHSMGNLQIAYFLRNNLSNTNLPKLNKQVSIAGHYNGYIGEIGAPKHTVLNQDGSPQKMAASYRGLLTLRKNFPKTANVLNIYGNTGKGNDGAVDVNSARSYRYLVSKQAGSYQEQEIYGKTGQHSQLHENQKVNQLLINFLWPK
ncbi:Uncharacterized protein with an alpha/beta hydrolase fold [Lactobacillus bombicola]|uniref:Uncharacterized protein with an alpha/beta hydrolase fold n=1 Tax=Lactobacillus bombicola TaxID=1505723 RepID=A0A1I1TVS1_9LACO|nr:alpha/beta hydrolase [Lactobacillus bombicola]MCO6528684.1 alpha/beta hydrolase [Lactobacillus sp.]SFD62697.1 Uncharacterized protein with an alpha/beta hydrolase fold [Lactobacillus bombicola]